MLRWTVVFLCFRFLYVTATTSLSFSGEANGCWRMSTRGRPSLPHICMITFACNQNASESVTIGTLTSIYLTEPEGSFYFNNRLKCMLNSNSASVIINPMLTCSRIISEKKQVSYLSMLIFFLNK